MGQRQIVGDIFAAAGQKKRQPTFAVATDQRNRFLDEETNHRFKYLAFSLNFSSNCDYNNR